MDISIESNFKFNTKIDTNHTLSLNKELPLSRVAINVKKLEEILQDFSLQVFYWNKNGQNLTIQYHLPNEFTWKILCPIETKEHNEFLCTSISFEYVKRQEDQNNQILLGLSAMEIDDIERKRQTELLREMNEEIEQLLNEE
jgi:hypothetical protein